MKNTFKLAAVVAGLATALIAPRGSWAFPDQEKAALNVVSSQATSFTSQGDRFLFISFSNKIFRFDTETFALTDEQIPLLTDEEDDETVADTAGDVTGLAVKGDTLFAAQSDGDILKFDLDDLTKEPSGVHVIEGSFGDVVADPDGVDNTLYALNPGGNAVVLFDTLDDGNASVGFVDGLGSPVSPEAIAFAASTGSSDKVYVTSNRGLIFVLPEGGTSLAGTITVSATNKDLPAAAATPNGDFLLVVDATDNVVHVYDTATNAEVDTDPVEGGVNPIAMDQNSSLTDIVVAEVSRPDDVYAFVAGSSGVSAIDLNLTLGGFGTPTVIDFNDGGSGDDEDDPLTLSSTPRDLLASSVDDGYLYSSNSNASLSVITDKPFVDIRSTSLGGATISEGDVFTITFRSDETGSFRVVLGANNAEVGSGTVDVADTDVVTPEIAFDGSVFVEGDNRIYVFVTDADGVVGRDAVDVRVDTPPPGIEILSTDFGDEKIFVTFRRLEAEDIDHYNLYVDSNAAAVATKTEVAGVLDQPGSGTEVKAKVTGLTNGTTFFIGLEAVDASGNVGVRTTTFPDGTLAFATPEETVGLAGSVGESGCTLITGRRAMTGGERAGAFLLSALAVLLSVFRAVKHPSKVFFVLILLSMATVRPAILLAEEKTPQWWSLEFKGGVWFPTNGTTKGSLGTIEPTGSIEFGFLYKSKFGAELGVGLSLADGTAFGAVSGSPSGDKFDLLLVPIHNSFVFRADFKEDQLLVPYVKAGPDYVFFRESLNGASLSGVKLGVHGAAGLQILLDRLDPLSDLMENSLGVNDVYFTVEGRYAWINNFGGNGLDLSGLNATAGFLFEF